MSEEGPCYACGTTDRPRMVVPLRFEDRKVLRPFCQSCIRLGAPGTVTEEEIVHRAILESVHPADPM